MDHENPYLEGYVPGGSSSGSAVSVADNMCFASMEQIRWIHKTSCKFCNVVGLKPTYGRVVGME